MVKPMKNSFVANFENMQNLKHTENGALAYRSTLSKVYDLFALGGAYRQRSDADIVLLFKEALAENETYALKCLFYLRDCRGGQGERRFFRVAYRWLCEHELSIALRNIELLSEYGRWDDLIYICEGTPAESVAFGLIQKQLILDAKCKTPSLLGKWMPSENASSAETARVANKLRNYMHLNHKEYRKLLSELRRRINVVERLMSAGMWDKIEFDKIPSKAGLIYKNAFARRDLIAKKYEKFIKSENTKVNAKTLYPYEVVAQAHAVKYAPWGDVKREAVNKYWANLPDYFHGSNKSILAVVDTSGSMTWGGGAVKPIDMAIGLGLYAAERNRGPFQNCYISFASRPQLIPFKGADFVDVVERTYRANLCDNTNLTAVFDLLLNMMVSGRAKVEDLPNTIVVISDMEIDSGSYWSKNGARTEMEKIRKKWRAYGIELPNLVYWNVNARNDTILDSGPNVSFCSGCSPTLFEQICSGKTGIDLMLDKLNADRYKAIQ